MTHFLVSDDNPDGLKLEQILRAIRTEVLSRCAKIANDNRSEAALVLNNSVKILALLGDAISLAENSTEVLDKSFGPGVPGGPPRIGD